MNEEKLRILLQNESCPEDMKNRVKDKIVNQIYQDEIKNITKNTAKETINDIRKDTGNNTRTVTYMERRDPVKPFRSHMIMKVAIVAACFCLTVGLGSLILIKNSQLGQSSKELESSEGSEDSEGSKDSEESDNSDDSEDSADLIPMVTTASITRIDPNAVVISYDQYQFILPLADTSGYQVGDFIELIQDATLTEEDKLRDDIIRTKIDQVRSRYLKNGFTVSMPETDGKQGDGTSSTDVLICLGDQMQTFQLGVVVADESTKSFQFFPSEIYKYDNTFLLDLGANRPDENGRFESNQVPSLMQPGSIISFVDDTHYAIISGGSYEYTPVTLLAEYQSKAVEKQICEYNQITKPEDTIPYQRMLVSYGEDGAIAQCYDFSRFITTQNELIDNQIVIDSQPYIESVVDQQGIKKADFNIAGLKITGQPQFDKINKTIQEFVDKTVEQGKQCIHEYDLEEFSIGVDCESFEFSSEYAISYNYNGLLQVQFSGYEYTGGVHPNTWLTCFLFDLATGEQIKLDQLVAVDETAFHEHIYSLFEQEKFKAEEGSIDVSFNGMNLEAANKLINFDMKYYLTKEGITFYFEPYEVHCYVAGYITLPVDYEDMIFQ